MNGPFYDALETRDPAEREASLMAALPRIIAAAKEHAPAYRRLLAAIEPEAITDRRALARLPEPEREVVKLRYGINGDDPTPLSETGRRLGLSQDAVRRLERKALSELAQNRELEALRPAA
jgi:RNA polymerase sigma factor (sigma-70 family)